MQRSGKKVFKYWVILWMVLFFLNFINCSGPDIVKEGPALPKPAKKPESKKFVTTLVALARNMENQNLIYSKKPENFRDCSGIFHRIAGQLKQKFPAIEIPPRQYRSSRDIAKWYNEKGGLIPVTDPLLQDNLIKPGSVMFYGRNKKHYDYINKNTVIRETEHVGIVVGITKKNRDHVESYELFHGRSGTKPAAITKFHDRNPIRSYYPPFGNGAQQWIGAAFIFLLDTRVKVTDRKIGLIEKGVAKVKIEKAE